jgi:hypothetical protein
MKPMHWIVIALFGLCAGCSTTFTEWRGASIVEGKGGTVRNVNGIDFWENGEPDCKFKILGVIDDTRGSGIVFGNGDGDMAKVAREHGGDAVLLIGKTRDFKGIDNNGNACYKKRTKVFVVKYLK